MRLKRLLITLLACFPLIGWAQTSVIKGTLVNDKGVPMQNAVVVLNGTNYQATTGDDGTFEMKNVAYGKYVLSVQDVEFSNFTFDVDANQPEVALKEVRALSSPSTVTPEADIPVVTLEDDESAGGTTQANVSSVLGASRDAFASAAQFNWSIAYFKVRGYEDEHFTTLMNGVPELDLVNERTAFASWSGLNDVVRSRESTTGLNPASYAFGGIGGSYSIDSRASRQRKQLQATFSVANRTFDNRFMLTYGSGFNKNGWAFAASYSRRWAKEGFVDGTYYDGNAYYLGVSKLMDKHELSFTVLGSQVENTAISTNTGEVYDIAGSHYYNSNWGYQNGRVRSSAVGRNHQPLFNLSHEWRISNNASLMTSASYTAGKRERTALNWFGSDPRPNYYRNFPSYFQDPVVAAQVDSTLKANPDALQVQWDNLLNANYYQPDTIFRNVDAIEGNDATGKFAYYMIENRVTETRRGSFNTVYNTIVNNNVSVSLGASYQQQTSRFYKVAEDLLGAFMFRDVDKFALQDFPGTPDLSENNLNTPNHIVREGDKFGYDYEAHLSKSNVWAQALAKYNKVDLFGALQTTYSTMYRYGNYRNGLFPEDSYGKSKTLVFTDIAAKGGLTYKLNGRNYLFVNTGFSSKAPDFDNAYLSPRKRNQSPDSLTNEKVSTVEGGYILTAPKFKFKLKGYFTHFTDGTETRSFFNEFYGAYVNYTLQGVEKNHTGVEISADANLGKGFSAIAVASIGQYYYSSRPRVTQTVDNSSETIAREIIYMENLHIGRTPQSAYTAGISYRSKKFWNVGASLNYFDNIYAVPFAPRRTADKIDGVDKESETWDNILSQQRFKGQMTLDLNAGWSIKLNNKIKSLKRNTFFLINLNINNVLDNKDIVLNGYEWSEVNKEEAAAANFSNNTFTRYSYAFGRTYMISFILRMN